MSPLRGRASGPHAGKRLSLWRLLLGVGAVSVVAVGGVFGVRWVAAQAVVQSFDDPWFAAYVDVTLTPTYDFGDPADESEASVVLAFLTAPTGGQACEPSWGGAYSLSDAARDLDLDRRIARLRDAGGDVVLSFGGAAGVELATACDTADQTRAAYAAAIDRYDVEVIDLDVENDDLADDAAAQRRAEAVAQLQETRDLQVWLTLPVSPTGLTADGIDQVRQFLAAGVDLAGVNAMTMDYGVDLDGRSMAAVNDSALEGLHAQLDALYAEVDDAQADAVLWAKIGTTPMIGQNDIPAEVFTLADAEAVNASAHAQGLGRVSMWSLNRDRSCSDNYAVTSVVSNLCSGVDQGDLTFAGVLDAGFSAPAARATTTGSPSPTASQEPTTPVDDPATSPYPIWGENTRYLAGTKTVWHGNVYEAKWWTQGDQPDDPLTVAADSPWTLIGPVLPGEKPYEIPTVPEGTYDEWDGAADYEAGDRVEFEGLPFEAKWWTSGDSPAAIGDDPDGSPWRALTAAEVAEVAAGADD
jgi:chitinase